MEGYKDLLWRVKDEHAIRFRDNIALHFGYNEFLVDGSPNPESKSDYIWRKQRNEWIERVKAQERATAIDAIVTPEIEVIL